ncbi:MAG: hypothetical protein P8N76_24095 [Pirellulaceae bacterium]|nr:hypothetical protein [Pirellulaceae bacterium]
MIRGKTLYTIIWIFLITLTGSANAQNQTETFSPVSRWNRDYQISVSSHSMNDADVPGLQSFVAGAYDEHWVILAGKTGGQHDFESGNRSAWVINPVTKSVWGRELTDPQSGLSQHAIDSLSSSNAQSYQRGQTLFISGGYVYETQVDNFVTYNDLTAVDLPELIEWVKTPGTQLPSNAILQTEGAIGSGTDYDDGFFQVTGGGMFEVDGTTQLVFGQIFNGPYGGDGSYQKYTSQIRVFDVDYDHATGSLGYSNATVHPAGGDPTQFRRRDLNTFPVLSKDVLTGEDELSGVALSGVFFEGNGLWTVPVEISPMGVPSMVNPASDPSVFKQAMNGYESAKMGLYSTTTGEMTEVLFGGITGNEFVDDPASGNLVYKSSFPYTNQISAVTIDSEGEYSQEYVGDFPFLQGPVDGPWLFGANGEFFPSADVALLEGDIIDLDSLTERTVIGFIYGGIASGSPDGGFGGNSIASSQVFVVEYIPVPEPAAVCLLGWSCFLLIARRRRVA